MKGTAEYTRLTAGVRDEASVLSRLDHPAVLALLGVVVDEQARLVALVMEPAAHSLRSFADHAAAGCVTVRLWVKWLIECTAGVQYLHSQSRVHGAINVDNVYVTAMEPEQPVAVKIGNVVGATVRMCTLLSQALLLGSVPINVVAMQRYRGRASSGNPLPIHTTRPGQQTRVVANRVVVRGHWHGLSSLTPVPWLLFLLPSRVPVGAHQRPCVPGARSGGRCRHRGERRVLPRCHLVLDGVDVPAVGRHTTARALCCQ